jgi:hypothetical protein
MLMVIFKKFLRGAAQEIFCRDAGECAGTGMARLLGF